MSGSRTRAGNKRWAASLAWTLLGVSISLSLAAVGLAVAGGGDLLVAPLSAALGLVFGVTGALVASRLPRNPIGWFFCAFAVLSGLSAVGDAYVTHAGGLPGRAWVAWINQWLVNSFSPAVVALSFLLFPTGVLPSARWRALPGAVVAAAFVHALATALAPGRMEDYPLANPAGLADAPWLLAVASGSLIVLVVPLILLSAASLFARLRRAAGMERQQIKWFAYAAGVMAIFLVAANAFRVLLAEPARTVEAAFFVLFVVVFSGIPISMGIAILRYRLYDIDLLINRTLVYAALTVMLGLIYVGSVASLQWALRTLTGGDSQLAVVASTLIIAALFNPLRRRIQGFIDRRFYRSKYDAQETLALFSTGLRDEVEIDALRVRLVAVIEETLRPEHASVWLRDPRRRARSG